MLNARKVARFKKGYDTLPKNDKVDAWVIADHLRFGRLPHEMQETLIYDVLRRLTGSPKVFVSSSIRIRIATFHKYYV